ncbi:MAG: capsule polysaccharide export protein KpsE/RkpR [Saprospiraceae bacterium]|jgi:capsule polysaccharide export protein KpsE/RkpR
MNKYFENDDILSIVWRWKKPLMMVFIVSSLISIIISSPAVIAPKYQSFARVYPSNLASYSEESYSEQTLQFLESDIIRTKLVAEFNLQSHYEIDNDDPHKVYKLYKIYSENVTFNKTKFESVEIKVVDISPDTAFSMLNRLIEIYNEQVKIVQDNQIKEAINTLEKIVKNKEAEMDTLEKKITFFRVEFGLLDYKSQVKNITKAYYKLLSSPGNGGEKIKKVNKELSQLKSKGAEFERLVAMLKVVRGEYAKYKNEYDQQYKELQREKKYINIVVNGYRSDKKVYPIRWLIILLSVASSTLLAFGIISFMDRINREEKSA